MGDRINFSLGNKTYYLLLGIFAVLIVSGVAYAYQSEQSPSVFGHSLEETQNFFISTQDNSGCFTDYTTEVDCNAEDTCFWNGESCSPLNPSSVTKIKLKAGVALTSDGTKAYATEGYVDSAVASVSVGGDGVPSVSVGAKCPRFIASSEVRSGMTFGAKKSGWYDGYLNTNGLQVDESSSGDEYVYYKDCVENSDGTVTFEYPILKDGGGEADKMYAKSHISSSEGYFAGIDSSGMASMQISAMDINGDYSYFLGRQKNFDATLAKDNAQVASILSKFCNDFGLVSNDIEGNYYDQGYTIMRDSESSYEYDTDGITHTDPLINGQYVHRDSTFPPHYYIMDSITCK
jgi:hypothetical protein